MQILLGLAGIVGSVFLVIYRETVGNMFGEAEWMQKVGGIYNVVVICAAFFFFWSLAYMTGTLDALFSPIANFLHPSPV